jgi:hypothetical protein
MIELKETKMKNILKMNTQIVEKTKCDILTFLEKVKFALIKYNNIQSQKQQQQQTNVKMAIENAYNLNDKLQSSNTIDSGSTNIIETKKTPYGNSLPSEFYKGVINPLERRIINKNLTIDTKFRENYYTTSSTNFLTDLPIQFNDVVSIQLDSIEFPLSYYIFSLQTGNTFFSIIINDEIETITINDGNYTNTELFTHINYLLGNLPPPFNQITISTANSFTNPNLISEQVIFESNPLSPFKFIIQFQMNEYGVLDINTPIPLKLGWMLGFRSEFYENETSYISEGLTNLLGSRYFFLVVDEFCNNKMDNYFSAFNNSILNKNILARIQGFSTIPTTNNNQNQIQNSSTIINNKRQYFGPVNITKMKIQLLNEYGQIVDLNHMDYSFSITLQTVYNL